MELLLHQDAPRRRLQDLRLRRQLARHLPELGSALHQLPRPAPQHRRQVRQRLDDRRLQPLPHHPRRHRLGGGRSRRPLEQYRLLGRPPDHLPLQTPGGPAQVLPGRHQAAARKAGLLLRPSPLPHQAVRRDRGQSLPTRSTSTPSPPRRSIVASASWAATASWSATPGGGSTTPTWSRSCWSPCSPNSPTSSSTAGSGSTHNGPSGTTPTTRSWGRVCRWSRSATCAATSDCSSSCCASPAPTASPCRWRSSSGCAASFPSCRRTARCSASRRSPTPTAGVSSTSWAAPSPTTA